MPAPLGPQGTWQLAFDDEFTESALDLTRWGLCDWTSGGVTRSAQNVALRDGHLVLTPPAPGQGAWVSSDPALGAGANGFTLSIGDVVEARVWFPGQNNLTFNWPSFWATAANASWPAAGEVDIAEGNGPLRVNYHYGTSSSPQALNNLYTYSGVLDAFHVYTFERGANAYQVFLDGNLVASWAGQDDGGPQGISLSTGTAAGATGNAAVYGYQARLVVDYVRAWVPA